MRIAFTGAHRVGKTTLAKEISSQLPGYELKNEPYLQLEEKGHLFSEIPILDDYIEQFNFSVKQITDSDNNVIFDRCPLDLLAYVYTTSRAKNIQMLYEAMIRAMSQIDLLIFVPIETPDLIFCQDSDMPYLRHDVNDIIQDWIGDLSNDIVEVTGTLAERNKQILKKL